MENEQLTGNIIGAAMKVHGALGGGFQEIIYQNALEIEFRIRGIANEPEKEMDIFYERELIGKRRVDFFVEKLIMVEIKAVVALEDIHLAQAKNYLEAYNMKTGLLINFGGRSLEFKRLYNKKYFPLVQK